MAFSDQMIDLDATSWHILRNLTCLPWQDWVMASEGVFLARLSTLCVKSGISCDRYNHATASDQMSDPKGVFDNCISSIR